MKVLKKAISITLAAVIAAGCFAGCGNNTAQQTVNTEYVRDENVNDPGVFPVCKEKIKLTVGIPQNSFITDYVDNAYTKEIEKQLNCELEFMMLPAKDTMQKVELMMAAGGEELPDIFCGVNFSDGALVSYGQSGMIVPLNGYYENSMYYLKDAMEKEPDLKSLITAPDGNMYYVPKYSKALSNEVGCGRAWINKTWLDKLGLEIPTTTAEFKEVLKAFKEQDPNGNGKADEIPFSGYTSLGNLCGLEYLFASHLKFTPKTSYLYAKDGKVEAGYVQDGWKQAIEYCADLYKEGLISDSTFTLDTNSFAPLKNNPEVPILGAFISMSMGFSNDVIDRYDDYVVLPPLEGEGGYRSSMWVPTVPSAGLVVTKNCENPEAAFRLGDFLCSQDMSLWNRWGELNVDWKYAEEGAPSLYDEVGYPAIVEMINNKWGVPNNAHWHGACPSYRDYALTSGQVASENNYDEATIATSTIEYMKYADMTDVKKFVYDMDVIEEATEINTNIESYVKEKTAAFVVGTQNIESDWDKYIAEINNMGLERLIEHTQASYDKMNAK